VAASKLIDDDLLDMIFENVNPGKDDKTFMVSLHTGDKIEYKDLQASATHPNQTLKLDNLETMSLTVSSDAVKMCKPGDIITVSDGISPDRNFQISSMMSAGPKCTDLELVSTPAKPPEIEVHVDYPEVEESALDIFHELNQ